MAYAVDGARFERVVMQQGVKAQQRRNLSERVVKDLGRQIQNGDYAAGDKLPSEPVLVERFGVSRTVIREAVAALRAEGLVEPRHGSGVYVLGPKPDPAGGMALFNQVSERISDIIEELEIRMGIEVEAAGLAALRASPAQEADIQHCLEEFARLVETGESTADADFAFHLSVAAATNNRRFRAFLEHIGKRVIPRIQFRSVMGGVDPLPNRDLILLAEHDAIVEAILQRDPEAAREAMRCHLLGGIKRYRTLTQAAARARAERD